MKNIYKSICYLSVTLIAYSCAKTVGEGTNVAEKRYFDAWMHINYPKLQPTWDGKESKNGIYIIPEYEVVGTGKTVTEDGFALVEYTVRDLDGNITEYTDSVTAVQLGEYDQATYYGQTVWITYDEAIAAGVQNAIVGMKVGGSRKVIIPSWYMTYSSYDTADEYLKHSSSYSSAIYEFTVKDFADSINVWEIETIEKYITDTYKQESAFSNDTTGFYFKSNTTYPEDVAEFPQDTTIYVNYTGRLLNGLVFDTTDEKTAKDHGIYSSSKEYVPVQINWGEDYSEITMGSDETSVVSGFALTIWRLKYDPNDAEWKDSCTGIFYSPLGYNYSGSGSSIPPYAPLIFDIEVADNPEE